MNEGKKKVFSNHPHPVEASSLPEWSMRVEFFSILSMKVRPLIDANVVLHCNLIPCHGKKVNKKS